MSDRGYVLYLASPHIGRASLGLILNRAGLCGEGVEIGVHRGEFARELLSVWRGVKLFGVDPYLKDYDDEDPAGKGNREDDKAEAETLHTKFPGRFMSLSLTSAKAGSWFSNTLDFVYIDGNHRYAHVAADLWMWWEKLKPGGILAGHDIMGGTRIAPHDGGWGHEVQRAVKEFAELKNVDVYLIPELDQEPWSYYMVKK